jgi:hypothetical protein
VSTGSQAVYGNKCPVEIKRETESYAKMSCVDLKPVVMGRAPCAQYIQNMYIGTASSLAGRPNDHFSDSL